MEAHSSPRIRARILIFKSQLWIVKSLLFQVFCLLHKTAFCFHLPPTRLLLNDGLYCQRVHSTLVFRINLCRYYFRHIHSAEVWWLSPFLPRGIIQPSFLFSCYFNTENVTFTIPFLYLHFLSCLFYYIPSQLRKFISTPCMRLFVAYWNHFAIKSPPLAQRFRVKLPVRHTTARPYWSLFTMSKP